MSSWPFDQADYTPERGRLLVLGVMFEGPWERAATWLMAIDWRTNEIKHEVRNGSRRARLATWCERRDHAWRRRYVAAGTDPHQRWNRRSPST